MKTLIFPGFKQLSAEKLAQAIDAAVNDAALRARAAALGEKIRAEDGVARAVEIIERRAEKAKVVAAMWSVPRTREGARRHETRTARMGRVTHERKPFPPFEFRVFVTERSRIRVPNPFS